MSDVPSVSSSTTIRAYDRTALVCCTVLLLLALLIGFWKHQIGSWGTETDFYGAYAPQVANILAGRPYTYQHLPPGYCWLLAGVSLLTGNLFVAGKLIAAFATGLFAWVTYLLLKRLFECRIALVSTLLTAIALLPYSFLATTDVLTALTTLLPLWVLLRGQTIRLHTCFIAGLLAGMAYLIRYNAMFAIAAITISLFFVDRDSATGRLSRSRIPQVLHGLWHKPFLCPGLFMAGVLIVTFPWLIVNWYTNGSPFTSTIYVQMAKYFYGLNPHASYSFTANPDVSQLGSDLQQLAAQFNSIFAVILHNPGQFFQKYLNGIFYSHIKNLAIHSLQFPAYLFAGTGSILLLIKPSWRQATFLFLCLCGHLFLGLFSFQIRYYFFLYPFLFLLVACCLFQPKLLANLGQIPGTKIALSWFIVFVLAVSLTINTYGEIKSVLASEPRHLLAIADFLKPRSDANDIILARKPHLAYFTGLRRVFPPAETVEDYLAAAQNIGVRYIVYSKFEASLWPGLKSLSDPEALPEAFQLIYQHKPSQTLIYELKY